MLSGVTLELVRISLAMFLSQILFNRLVYTIRVILVTEKKAHLCHSKCCKVKQEDIFLEPCDIWNLEMQGVDALSLEQKINKQNVINKLLIVGLEFNWKFISS